MGEVYLGRDNQLERFVALKILSRDTAARQGPLDDLLREARAASALNHQNIVTVYEIADEESVRFIASEFVTGESLRVRLDAGALDSSEAMNIAAQIAEGLAAAHRAGVVHRDLTPQNIMIRHDGVVKILDFGLSRLPLKGVEIERNGEDLDNPEDDRAPAGTLAYMAPDLLRGSIAGAHSDIWSLGVIFFELLAGHRPFSGDTPSQLIRSILHDEPGLVGVPLALENIVRRALEKKRADRYTSVLDLAADLEKVRREMEAVPARQVLWGLPDIADGAAKTTAPAKEGVTGALRAAAWRHRGIILGLGLLMSLAAAVIRLGLIQSSATSEDLWLWLIAGLCFLIYALARRTGRRATYSSPTGVAFRGLMPFHEADRERFYGREMQTLALEEMITQRTFRFGVLFGDSGCGKTSLVSAGLIPRLWAGGYTPIYCRSYTDPLAALLEECRKRSLIEPYQNEPAPDYLQRVSHELSTTIVVICDQFEEFFVNFKTASEREPFVSFVAACHRRENLAVKFLFSLRSDFLYLINSQFAGRIPDPLISSRLYHLRDFTEDEAMRVIEKSARYANLPFAEGLSRHVARDLMSNGAVLPSELQIVGERLQSRGIYTVPEYQRAGGKEQLVHGFIEDAIQASGDSETAQLLLRSLISDGNTRVTLPLEEIVKRTQRSPKTIEHILNLFVAARLIRELQDERPWRYELMHEYLIVKVNLITGRVLDATQRANRLFRQYSSNYALDKSTRIPLSRLWSINRYADIRRGGRERELLKKSLRLGVLKAGALLISMGIVVTVAAAALSVNEEWEGARLRDGHAAAARQAAFSPDGRLLVSVGEDGLVIVWDFARREWIATLTEHTIRVTSVDFSPDGKWFVTGSPDYLVVVWDSATFEKVSVLRAPQQKAAIVEQEEVAVAFSPDGRLLTFMSGDRTILWKTGQWNKVGELPAGLGGYGNFLFSPDSRRLILRGGQGWDITTGKQVAGESDPSMLGNWIALSPDGSRLVSLTTGGKIVFLDAHKGNSLGQHVAHQGHGRAVAFSRDGKLIATGAEDTVLWDAATQTPLSRLEHPASVWSLGFSPDGRWLVSTHADGAILVWDVAERRRVANLNEHSAPVLSVAFSADGKHLASASEDSSVIIWHTERGTKETVLLGHKTRVNAVAISADGKGIASVSQDSTLILWEVEHRRPAVMITSGAYCVAISPDGRFAATNNGVHERKEGRLIADYEPYKRTNGTIYGLAFSPDGKRLAWVSAGGQILLLDTDNWQARDSLVASEMSFKSVSFSPDGARLVTGDAQGVVRLWQVSPLRELAVVGRHAGRINSVAFAPDGRQVASAGDDQVIALWDVGGQRLVTRVGAHTAPVLSVAFSPDGRHLAAGEENKSVQFYTRRSTLWGYRWNGLRP